MISRTATIGQPTAWILAAMAILLPALHAQQEKDNALRVPHTVARILVISTLACAQSTARSVGERASGIPLEKSSRRSSVGRTATCSRRDESDCSHRAVERPGQAGFSFPRFLRLSRSSSILSHQQYAFQWDENRALRVRQEISPGSIGHSGHPPVSNRGFQALTCRQRRHRDLLFSSGAIVDVGAPSWQRWITRDAYRATALAQSSADDRDVLRPYE